MIIRMNTNTFEMDIRSLVMAFFLNQEIRVSIGEFWDESWQTVLDVAIHEEQFFVAYYENSSLKKRVLEQVLEKDRKLRRDRIKQMVYKLLSECLDMTLPWGTLTGIRPVKMIRGFLEDGRSEQDILEELEDYYYVNQDKRKLSLEIAKTELNALSGIPYKDGYSLYVGIPFCPSTCAYCSFTSYPLKVWEGEVDRYIELLCKEIEFTTDLFSDKRLCTIYVGGGTPTTLTPAQMGKLLDKLRDVSSKDGLFELTVEAGRPDSITRDKLQVLRDYGVSRISINPQTMNDETLRRIGRRHTVSQVVEAYELARELGFDNINMDLIMGLPGESVEDVSHTMEQIRELEPDSLTVHSLAIKRAARLNTFREDYSQYASVNTQAMLDMVRKDTEEMGLVPYYLYRQKNMTGNFENVGYAKGDKIGLYNILIMEEIQTIAAVGAGGSSKLVYPMENRIERVENVKDVRGYMERFEEMLDRKRKAVLCCDA